MAEGGSGIWTPGGEHQVGAREPAPEAQAELSPEELTELMRRVRIGDFLLSNLSTLAQLAYGKLDRESRDLADARLAIESLRALLPVLEGSVPEQLLRDFTQMLSNLQLAYVSAADEERAAGRTPPAEGSPGGEARAGPSES